ncbi:MAG: dihydrodipicolinate synthase family protein [Clostridia bacterium]|nr:dihydrodipicolinate synthase family protein [Clostridia bacterium]
MPAQDYGTQYDRLYVAVVTPYKKDSFEVDESALRKLLRYFMQPKFRDAGGGIIINPEAGEVFYLTREEKRRNVEIAVEECGGKVPVFAGVIALTTDEAVQVAVDAKKVGADGLFLCPPIGAMDVTTSWNAERYPEVWVDMAKAIVDAADLPAIAHPVASPTPTFGIGLPLSATLKMVNEVPNFVGWKMTYSYEGYRIIARALRSLNRHVGVFGAPAVYFHEALATGQFDGTVTGSFCYAMEPMIDHIEAWRRSDVQTARKIWDAGLAELQEYVYSEYARLHVRYKTATWLRGLIPHPLMRPPLPRPKKEEILTLKKLLAGAGLSVIPDFEVEKVLGQL